MQRVALFLVALILLQTMGGIAVACSHSQVAGVPYLVAPLPHAEDVPRNVMLAVQWPGANLAESGLAPEDSFALRVVGGEEIVVLRGEVTGEWGMGEVPLFTLRLEPLFLLNPSSELELLLVAVPGEPTSLGSFTTARGVDDTSPGAIAIDVSVRPEGPCRMEPSFGCCEERMSRLIDLVPAPSDEPIVYSIRLGDQILAMDAALPVELVAVCGTLPEFLGIATGESPAPPVVEAGRLDLEVLGRDWAGNETAAVMLEIDARCDVEPSPADAGMEGGGLDGRPGEPDSDSGLDSARGSGCSCRAGGRSVPRTGTAIGALAFAAASLLRRRSSLCVGNDGGIHGPVRGGRGRGRDKNAVPRTGTDMVK